MVFIIFRDSIWGFEATLEISGFLKFAKYKGVGLLPNPSGILLRPIWLCGSFLEHFESELPDHLWRKRQIRSMIFPDFLKDPMYPLSGLRNHTPMSSTTHQLLQISSIRQPHLVLHPARQSTPQPWRSKGPQRRGRFVMFIYDFCAFDDKKNSHAHNTMRSSPFLKNKQTCLEKDSPRMQLWKPHRRGLIFDNRSCVMDLTENPIIEGLLPSSLHNDIW